MARGLTAVSIALGIAYPLLVYLGLQAFEPWHLGLALIGILALRFWRWGASMVRDFRWLERALLLTLLALVIAAVAANSETLLRLYPVLVSLNLLALFGTSLMRPPSIIERFARRHDPQLPPAGVRYTWRVTLVWCVFFAFNGTVALYTALWTSREIWTLYNGLVAYLLIGGLFAGEWLYRRVFILRPS
jgi:uncharacterized membrane protein